MVRIGREASPASTPQFTVSSPDFEDQVLYVTLAHRLDDLELVWIGTNLSRSRLRSVRSGVMNSFGA